MPPPLAPIKTAKMHWWWVMPPLRETFVETQRSVSSAATAGIRRSWIPTMQLIEPEERPANDANKSIAPPATKPMAPSNAPTKTMAIASKSQPLELAAKKLNAPPPVAPIVPPNRPASIKVVTNIGGSAPRTSIVRYNPSLIFGRLNCRTAA